MSFEVLDVVRVPIKAWTRGVPVEDVAKQQLRNIASMPFVYKHVAVMPDVHWGMGATVGSVIATKGAIIPAAVGVDIGCGMMAMRTSLVAADLPDNLGPLRSAIEAAVPHGRSDDGGRNDKGAHDDPRTQFGRDPLEGEMAAELDRLVELYPKLKQAADGARRHVGTLGGGNHFIEVCLDEEQRVWVMLHSGSRGIGNKIGQTFINAAKKDMERWFIHLPDADLAYIPEGSTMFKDYQAAVEWAQRFAQRNRELMMEATLGALAGAVTKPFICDSQAVQCHHNYVSWEHHFGQNVIVTRKGAVSAREGQLGIIPGSMGVRSYIVRGKGNPDSFHSCSHGAGRAMSRTQAAKTFTLEDHATATAGVECRKDAGVLDETPGAYKDLDAVMAAQRDLVDVVHTLKQVLCVKG